MPADQEHPLRVLGGLGSGTAQRREHLFTSLYVISLGLIYILLSAGLISYNKYLINADRFPYAVALVLCHMLFCSTLAAVLYLLKPSLFPSLTDPTKRVAIDRQLILTGALPIAFLFAAQLILSNTAYLHSSVAFLQMMKEANLVLVYCLSLAVALERFEWRYARLLIIVLFATALTIHGELKFSTRGFALQGLSQIFESVKIVLQAALLTNAGRKLDALTYVLIVTPMCLAILALCTGLLVYAVPISHFATPHWADVVPWIPHLIANSSLAFMMNVVVALFVKNSSAVAFILVGVTKDAMIVMTGGLLLKEIISKLQYLGFAMQLSTIAVYSLNKSFPDKFERGIASGLAAVLCGREEKPASPHISSKAPAEIDYGTENQSKKLSV